MSKFLNDKDFFICSGGLAAAQMQTTQHVAGKKGLEAKFLTKKDTNTSSLVDFSCKKLMLLMAAIAIIVCALVIATGGAALIAAACIGGAIGAIAGALICGQQAAAARVWIGYKTNAKLLDNEMLTDKAYMKCRIFNEEIRIAPHIKNWWQALAVGLKNFSAEMFKCVMLGAAVAGAAVLATEGASVFLGNALTTYIATWTTGPGLLLRGAMGAMDAITGKYEQGLSTEDALSHGMGASLYGMEQGTAFSAYNVATGQGSLEDFAGLLAWGAPIAKANEKSATPNSEVDPMGESHWEGKPQSGKTGFLDSPRMSRSELKSYKEVLNSNGIETVVDKTGILPENAQAGFDPNTGTVFLRKGATQYEAFHEQAHAEQWSEMGKESYLKQNRLQREQHVYDRIMANKEQFSAAELEHARTYINRVRSEFGEAPLDAMEEGKPKASNIEENSAFKVNPDGDLYEDPISGETQKLEIKSKLKDRIPDLEKKLIEEGKQVTKQDIIDTLKGSTDAATEIAEALESNNITLRLLSDKAFAKRYYENSKGYDMLMSKLMHLVKKLILETQDRYQRL